jgi:hypothetical protein
MTHSALFAALIGMVVAMSLCRVFSACYPGLQTLCRWVMAAASSAGLLLGGAVAVLAVHGGMEIEKAAAAGSFIVLVGQMGGWLMLLRWLPGRGVAIVPSDERVLLQSLEGMSHFMRTVGAAQ